MASPMQVPLLDLKQQFASIRDEMLQAAQQVIESQACINGPAVGQLEARLADYCDCTAAVGLSSGTDALLACLMALEIGPGDDVIVPAYTFFATAGCVWRVGASPVFADIEPDTFNIDPAKVAQAVTEKTRAVIPVHLFGQTAEMDPIMEIARARGLAVIEDAAQAIGATYKGRKAGSIGTAGCLSFYPSKNLGGIGDGGMIVTQDAALAETLLALRQHGENRRYHHRWVGGNFRLDTIQAAALLVKLSHLDDWSAGRRANAAKYDGLFSRLDAVTTPTVRPENTSVFNQYVIRTARRDALRAFLDEQGVGTAGYYPMSLHEQECFAPLGGKRGDFPESERAAAESLALPIYPELTDEQIGYVAGKVKEFLH